jgi:hypothetical protein
LQYVCYKKAVGLKRAAHALDAIFGSIGGRDHVVDRVCMRR